MYLLQTSCQWFKFWRTLTSSGQEESNAKPIISDSISFGISDKGMAYIWTLSQSPIID